MASPLFLRCRCLQIPERKPLVSTKYSENLHYAATRRGQGVCGRACADLWLVVVVMRVLFCRIPSKLHI